MRVLITENVFYAQPKMICFYGGKFSGAGWL